MAHLKHEYLSHFNEVFFSHCTNSLIVENLEKFKDIKIHLQIFYSFSLTFNTFFLKEKHFPYAGIKIQF